MNAGPPLELVVTSFDDPLVTVLRRGRPAEAVPVTSVGRGYGGRYAPPAEAPPDAGMTFLLARQGGDVVGYSGLRRLGDDTAELERVQVRTSYHGPDLTRLLLAGVEDLARRRGFAVARIAAGDLHAAGPYVAGGYVRIAPFGRHPDRSVCLEKSLRVTVPAPRPPVVP